MKLVRTTNWVNVYHTNDPFLAQILKAKLEDQDIPVVLYDQRDSSYNAFGYLYLSVPNDREMEAKKLIEQDA